MRSGDPSGDPELFSEPGCASGVLSSGSPAPPHRSDRGRALQIGPVNRSCGIQTPVLPDDNPTRGQTHHLFAKTSGCGLRPAPLSHVTNMSGMRRGKSKDRRRHVDDASAVTIRSAFTKNYISHVILHCIITALR